MQPLFCNKFITLQQGFPNTEEYIIQNASNGWIEFQGYEFYRDFVKQGLFVPSKTCIRTSNGVVDRCYRIIDLETLKGINEEIAAHQGPPGMHKAQQVLEDNIFCSAGWSVASRDLAFRLKLLNKS